MSLVKAATSTIDGNKTPEICALLLASLVQLAAALLLPDISLFAVVLGTTSLVITFLMLVLSIKCEKQFDRVLCTLPKIGKITPSLLLALFLFGGWAVGWYICTFHGVFSSSGNGYFASVAALVSSAALLVECLPSVDAAIIQGRAGETPRPQLALFLCGLAVVLSSLETLGYTVGADSTRRRRTSTASTGSWETTLVIVMASVVMACTALQLLIDAGAFAYISTRPQFPAQVAKLSESKIVKSLPALITLVTCVLWAVLTVVGTFRAPFLLTGNGYFASWLGAIAAYYAIQPHFPESLKKRMKGLKAKVLEGGGAPADEEAAAPAPEAAEADPKALQKELARVTKERDAALAEVEKTKTALSAARGAVAPSPAPKTPSSKKLTPSAFGLQDSSPATEQRLMPLIEALGEAQQKTRQAQAEREAAVLELDEMKGGVRGLEADRDAAVREATQHREAAVKAEAARKEAESKAKSVEAELADALAELGDVDEGGGNNATLIRERDDALAARDEARTALATAESTLEQMQREREEEKEKQRQRAEAGRAALANRQAQRERRADSSGPAPARARRETSPNDEDLSARRARRKERRKELEEQKQEQFEA